MTNAASNHVTVSIVSHGHGSMVIDLLNDLRRFPEVNQIILTLNIPESLDFSDSLQDLMVIKNPGAQGFGANHNQASKHCLNEFFCILNPDIRIAKNPFPQLISELSDRAALVAPLVVNSKGILEDSARFFPTPLNMVLRLVGISDSRYPLGDLTSNCEPDWVAGMFLLTRTNFFCSIGGFNENYFLYLEDAEFSLRIWRSGRSVRLCKSALVVHDARRSSHKKIKYLYFHLFSLIRFLLSNFRRSPRND